MEARGCHDKTDARGNRINRFAPVRAMAPPLKCYFNSTVVHPLHSCSGRSIFTRMRAGLYWMA